jgi:hypothetical protein
MASALGKPTETHCISLSQETTAREVIGHFIQFCNSDIANLLGPGTVSVEETSHGRWLASVPSGDNSAIVLKKTWGIYEIKVYGGQLPRGKTTLAFLDYCMGKCTDHNEYLA